jgi:hypothetical protein
MICVVENAARASPVVEESSYVSEGANRGGVGRRRRVSRWTIGLRLLAAHKSLVVQVRGSGKLRVSGLVGANRKSSAHDQNDVIDLAQKYGPTKRIEEIGLIHRSKEQPIYDV